MSGREWKPGDVAVLRILGREHVALRDSSGGWSIGDSRAWRYLPDDFQSPLREVARPLAVIDPEDAEQVERLWRIWTTLAPDYRLAQDNMQAALREFADPRPQIEEPQGLGAVVRDAKGKVWVRDAAYRDRWFNSGDGKRADFDQIDAVEVLSEGWSE